MENNRPVTIQMDTLHVMVLHGALQLALRNPGWNGPCASLGVALLRALDEALAVSGVLPREKMERLRRDSAAAIAESESRRT